MCQYNDEEPKTGYFYPTVGFAVILLLAQVPMYLLFHSMKRDINHMLRNIQRMERVEKEPINVIRSSYDRMEDRAVKPANDPTEEPKFWEK